MSLSFASSFITKNLQVSATSAGGSADVIYTVPKNTQALILKIMISNGGAAAKQIYVQWYDSSTTTYFTLISALSVAANSFTNIISNDLITIHSEDKIVVYMEAGATLFATVTAEQFVTANKIVS